MKKEITITELEKFQKRYDKNPANKLIENAITRSGIDSVCFNRETLIDNQDAFNIEVETGKVQNQKNSGRCWCFAGTNMIKGNIAKNMNIDIKNFELSNVYLTFYDRLEKFNVTYENLFTAENLDYDYLREEQYLFSAEGGFFDAFAYLVDKYGLVPLTYMPETVNSSSSSKLNTILQEKIKYDANIIIEMRKNKASLEELRQKKEEMLGEVYEILCKVLGEPVKEFTLEYTDKDKKQIYIENMTPLKFKEQYLTLDLSKFVILMSIEHYKKDYYQRYQNDRIIETSASKPTEYINIPMNDFKKLTIKQLKDNVPVWFSTSTNKMWNRQEGILDMRNYNYYDLLGMKPMDRKTAYNMREIPFGHSMVFVGVHLVNNEPVRWKVENSWGAEKTNKQFLIMNDNYFEARVNAIVIHEKYLPKKIKECLTKEPILINTHEL